MEGEQVISPQLILDVNAELFVDNFAGGGGASTGIERALGRHVDHAVNHDRNALGMHRINHPQTVHHCEDVFDVDPTELTEGRPVGAGWFSPDCFPAGTLVLLKNGYAPIESVKVGDEVLTHKGRWRKVNATHSTDRTLITIRGHGHPGIRVSGEHPFLMRKHQRVYPVWAKAGDLQKGDYWAHPASFPESDLPAVGGRGMTITTQLMWLAGRYIGDGWTRLTKTRAELVITCGMHEREALRKILSQWPRANGRALSPDELSWHERATATAYQFTTNHRGLVEWLRTHFRHRAECKLIPGWALGMPENLRRALLDGYLSADGHETETFWEATTVSKALAFSLKALAASLGQTAAIYSGRVSNIIQGRNVNCRPSYRIRWRHKVDPAHRQTFRSGLHEWAPIREVGMPVGYTEKVFNIGVEEDESYVTEGIVVHNCTHFSKAKGGRPLSKKIRGLAFVILRWAKIRTRVIYMENVEEIQTWGPLLASGKPDPKHKGRTWKAFLSALGSGVAPNHPDLDEILEVLGESVTREELLRGFGYEVQTRELRACDYGAPTIRKRLFLIARCDGLPVVWPKPTHAKPEGARKLKLKPWRPVAECIDWSIPCNSIFLTRAQARKVRCKRPLARPTLRRVATGIGRFVLHAKQPFLVNLTHQGGERVESIGKPLNTITGANRGEKALVDAAVAPFVTEHANASNQRTMPADEPLRTQCAEVKGGHFALVAGSMVQTGYGEAGGQAPRALDIGKPLGTAVSGGKHAIIAAHLAVNTTQHPGAPVDAPAPTVTNGGHHIVAASSLVKLRGGVETHGNAPGVDEPMHTASAGGQHHGLISAHLAQHNGGFNTTPGHEVSEPISTISGKGSQQQVVAGTLAAYYGTAQDGQAVGDPLRTVTAKQRFCHVESRAVTPALTPEQLAGARRVTKFLRRFGVEFEGELATVRANGHEYVIVDIGMRMLTPRELFRAQGFPDDYVIDRAWLIDVKTGDLKEVALTKEQQIRMCGNSVSPPVAEALVRANSGDMAIHRLRKTRKTTPCKSTIALST